MSLEIGGGCRVGNSLFGFSCELLFLQEQQERIALIPLFKRAMKAIRSFVLGIQMGNERI